MRSYWEFSWSISLRKKLFKDCDKSKQFWTVQCRCLCLCVFNGWLFPTSTFMKANVFHFPATISVMRSVWLAFWLGKIWSMMFVENHTISLEEHAIFLWCSKRQPFWWLTLCLRINGTCSFACLLSEFGNASAAVWLVNLYGIEK